MFFEDEETVGGKTAMEQQQHQKTLSPRPLDGSTDVGAQNPQVAEGGGVLPIGRTLESQRNRQAVYIGFRTEGFSTDEAPGDVTMPQKLSAPLAMSSGTTIQHLLNHNTHRNHFKDCDASEIVKPPGASTYVESWSRIPAASTMTAAVPSTFPPGKVSPEVAALTPSIRGPKPMSLSKSFLGASQSLAASQTPLSGGGRSPGRMSHSGTLSPVVKSPMARLNLIPHDLAVNCLDEKQTLSTTELWWKSSAGIPDDVLQDVPPDLFMEIHYPQQGFYVKMKDADCAKYSWNERFQSVFNVGETADRRIGISEFVRDFAVEAIPFAMEVLGNLSQVPSPVVHKNGITVEIPWLMPSVKYMFDDEGNDGFIKSMKTVNLEYNGRHFATMGACPQLNIPFTLMVEYIGVKALVYPRLPLHNGGFPAPKLYCGAAVGDDGHSLLSSVTPQPAVAKMPGNRELVYGVERPEWFHTEPLMQHDSEVNAVVQRLAMLTRCKGCWLGKEFHDKRYIHGPVEMKVFRSDLDNRIYAKDLGRLCPTNTLSVDAATEDEDKDENSNSALVANLPRRPNDYLMHRFRPEFIQKHLKLDISSESTSPIAKINTDKDESERLQFVDMLMHYVIPQAAEQLARDVRLNGVTWPFIARGGVSHLLHSWGINMRHLVLVHQKLIRTKMSGKALKYVEIEIVARALKNWALRSAREHQGSGEVREYSLSEALASCLVPFSDEFWQATVWPAIVHKYSFFKRKTVQKWEASRVDHPKVIQRLFRMVGAVVTMNETDAVCDRWDWIKTAADLHQIQIRFFPVVKCPTYPRAPLEEGQDVHLMILAKRYLREVTVDLKYNPVSNRDMLERYIAFLEQMGERHCEEVAGFYIAEQERKDRVLKGAKPSSYAEAGKDERTIKYRLKGNRGMRVLEISREALDRFKFYQNQKVQQTLGGDSGQISTIIGVIDGVLYHHEEGADGATELFGRNFNEIQGNYGLVLLDKLMYLKRTQAMTTSQNYNPAASATLSSSPLANISPSDVALKHPYHQVGDRGLLIFESSAEIVFDAFSAESGQRFMYLRGPRRGNITTVIGMMDGCLWHQLDGATQYEVLRVPSSTSSDQLSDDGRGGLSITSIDMKTQQQQRFAAFRHSDAVTMARSKLWYPIDPGVVYEDSLDIFAGYRSCVACGFFYRQIVQFQKGPYADMRGVILGALSGNLQCLLPFRHVPVALGTTQAEIVEAHSPQVVGVLSYNPVHEPQPQFLHYPGLGGDLLRFDASYGACLPFGGVRGQRVKVVLGHLAGLCGFVVGCRSAKLWAQLDGESGAQPLVQGSFVLLRGSIFVPDRSIEIVSDSVTEAHFLAVFPSRDAQPASLHDDASPDITVRYLAEFGEVIALNASPVACDSFGFYHSQRLRVQRTPRRSLADDLSADVLFVVVVGVFHGELFYVVEGEPYARPFLARNRWQLEWMYAPDVVGLSPITNFSDMFCHDNNRLQWSGIDAFYEDPRVQLAYCVATDAVIGLDTLGVASLHSAWRCGSTIIRQDRVVSETLPNGSVIHRPDGPQATVWGTFNHQLYIEFRSSYDISIGRANASSTLRRVEIIPLKECPKWLPCAGWQHQSRKTFLSPEEIKKSESYESRIGIETLDTAIFTHWWCYLMRTGGADEERGDIDMSAISMLQQQTSQVLIASTMTSMSGFASPPSTPAVGQATTPPPPPRLVLFSRDVSQCLEKLFEVNGGKRGSHYDVDGGAYYIETMEYIVKNVMENTKATYDMVREPLESINSYVHHTFRVDVKAYFPEIHDALLARVAARIQAHPGMEMRYVSIRRQTEIAFARDEIQLMHEVCEIFPTMLYSALERVGRSLPAHMLHEVELRYAYVPAPIRVAVLRWVLTLLGVSCGQANLPTLYLLLVSMEKCTGIVTDVPTMEEFDMHVREQMSALVEFEASLRLAMLQEERNEWLRRMPRRFKFPTKQKLGRRLKNSMLESSVGLAAPLTALEAPTPFEEVDAYDGMSLRVTKSCLSIANEKFAALMTHKTAHNVACAKRLPLMHRFALQDGTALLLEPSCMTFQRGDVVEYTLGDIQGLRATIVGMFRGHLWRYEHTGVYSNLVMPFAGNETDIQARYGLKVIKRENPSQVRLYPAHSLKLKESNVISFLCYDGLLRDLDPSHHAVSPYGVLAGDRYTTTDDTNLDLFPFNGLVVLIVGVCKNGLLWFTVDQTGAMPFKNLGPDENVASINVVECFSLRRAYHAPFRQPSFEPSKLIACLGVVGPEEGAVSGTIGPMTLAFLAAPDALKSQFNIAPGAKIAITSGDNKGRRLSVVGMRHGKLWVMWEYEPAARPLKNSGLLGFDYKVLSSDASGGFKSPESTTQLNLNQLLGASTAKPSGSWLRFPTQRGGLALFQTDCFEAYKVESGQQVMYSVARKGAATLPKKKAIIVGIRDGGLWKVDEFECEAKPFIGVLDVATLHKKFDISAGPLVGVESETW